MLGETLKNFRVAQDLTTRDIADKMKKRTSYITDVERGDRTPTIGTLRLFAEALEVDMSYILYVYELRKSYSLTRNEELMIILAYFLEKKESDEKINYEGLKNEIINNKTRK